MIFRSSPEDKAFDDEFYDSAGKQAHTIEQRLVMTLWIQRLAFLCAIGFVMYISPISVILFDIFVILCVAILILARAKK